ncbi:hypothetical protein ACHAPJ_010096 [Fusarium lateritium]
MPDSTPPVPIQDWDSVIIPVRADQSEPGGPTAVSAVLMKLIGIRDSKGALIGQRFMSSRGPDSNILFSSNIYTRAMIYQGTRERLQAAANAVGWHQKSDEINAWVFALRLRFVPTEDRIWSVTGNLKKLSLSANEIAAILVPVDRRLNESPSPSVLTPVSLDLVLESFNPDTIPQDKDRNTPGPRLSPHDRDALVVSHVNITNGLQIEGLTSAFRCIAGVNIVGEQSHDRMLSNIMSSGQPPSEPWRPDLRSIIRDECLDLPTISVSPEGSDEALREVSKELTISGAVPKLREFVKNRTAAGFRCLRCICLHETYNGSCFEHLGSPRVDVMDTSDGKKLMFRTQVRSRDEE